MLILIVASGPDKGCIYELAEDQPVVLGRDSDQIKLNDRKASRQHAKLWAEGGRWYIRDLDSRHGTTCNSQPITSTKTPLNDGDRIRVGNTQFVLARMPVEQAERMHLLGEPPSEKEVRRSTSVVRQTTRWGAFAVAASITAIAGLNIYSLMQSQTQNDQLREQIASVEQSDDTTGSQLQQILASLEQQTQRDALLEEIRTTLALQPDNTDKLEALLAKVDAQSNQSQTLDEMRDLLDQQLAAVEPIQQSLQEIAAASSEQRQTLEGVVAHLHTPVEPPAPPVDLEAREKLDTILAQLQTDEPAKLDAATQRQLDTILQAVSAKVEPDDAIDTKTQEKLDTILARVEAQPDTNQLAEQITTQVASHVADQLHQADLANTSLLQQIATNLEEQQTLSTQITELRHLIARQPQATRDALDQAIANLSTQQDTQAMLTAIESIKSALPAEADEKLDQVLSKLDAQATPQQLAAALQAVIENQPKPSQNHDAVLTAIENQSLTQQANLRQLHDQLEQLAQAQHTTPEAIIGEIRSAMATREDADARLAELMELANAQPQEQRTEALLQEVLTELRERSEGPSDEVLRQVLRELRSKAIASMDELRATIRSELDVRLASIPAHNPASPITMAQIEPVAPRKPHRSNAGSAILLTQDNPTTQTITNTADRAEKPSLTHTEAAYKQAFESGEPVVLGGEQIDPTTGNTYKGKTLDPSAARSAGIRSWREWYLMDDFSERMRLQQQAARFHEKQNRDPNVVSLPSPNLRD